MSAAMRDRPAGAADEGGLDEIVAEDMPAEGRLAGKIGSPAASVKAAVRMMALWPQ